MSPKRGDRAARPPRAQDWEIRFGDSSAANGWEDLCQRAPGPTGEAYDILSSSPRSNERPTRQHRLRGSLGTRVVAGEELEQWQYEVTAGGRIWYCIDDAGRRVILTFASTKHPKQTE